MAGETYEQLMATAEKLLAQGDSAGAQSMVKAAARLRISTTKPSLIDTAKEVVGQDMQSISDLLTLFQKGLTFGQAPNIQGAVSAMTGGSFDEGRQQMLDQEARASENMTVAGVPMGALPEALGGVVTGSAYMKPLQKAVPAVSGWLGTLLTGGGEGTLYAQGQGQDTTEGALAGAGGSALGRAALGAFNWLGNKLPNFNVQENAAQKIVEQTGRAGINEADAIPALTEAVNAVGGPSAALADTDILRPFVKGALTPMSSPDAMSATYNLTNSADRNVADMALTGWDSIFPTPRTINEKGEATRITLDAAKQLYEDGLNNSRIKFPANPFEKLVTTTFGSKPIDKMKSTRDALLSFIKEKTPIGPDGQTRMPMTPRDLLDIKDAVDARIKDVTDGAADAKTKRHLSIISKNINETLKGYVPEIKDAADIYSGQYSFDAAYNNGYELGKQGLKNQSLADLRELVDGFTPAQKAAYAEGWRKGKFELADAKGVEGQIKKVGPTKSNAELEIIESIFGPGTGDKIATLSNQITAVEKTNKQMGNQWNSVSEAAAKPKGDALNSIRQFADLMTMASQGLQNKVLGGAFQGAFGREARAVGATAQAQQGDQILDWATRFGTNPQGQLNADEALREIEMYLLRGQPTKTTPEMGAAAGRSTAAFERALRDRQ